MNLETSLLCDGRYRAVEHFNVQHKFNELVGILAQCSARATATKKNFPQEFFRSLEWKNFRQVLNF